MADLYASNWSETDGSNTTAAPNGAPEGMAPGGLNDTLRAVMGAIKRFVNQSIPATTGGTSTAYTVSYSVAPGALVDGMTHVIRLNATNGANPTLNVNSLGAKPFYMWNGTAFAQVTAAGVLASGLVMRVSFNNSEGSYRIISAAATGIGAVLLTANNAFSGNNTFSGTSTFTGGLTATSGTNAFTGTLGSASVGTTQSAGDSTTKLATTAFVTTALAATPRIVAACNWAGGGTTITSQFNVSSITRNSDGNYTLTYTNAVAADAFPTPSIYDPVTTGGVNIASQSTTEVRIASYDSSGTLATDFDRYIVIVVA